jgi:ribonuclease HI
VISIGTLSSCSFAGSFGNFRTPQNPSVIITAAAKEWFNAQAHYNVDHAYSMELLCWSKPPTGFFKLNIDGSRQGSSGKIGAGGVIRCSSGKWIKAFQANLGIGDVLDAETWSLFYGLKLALKCNIDHLLIESDSAILVKLILQSDTTLHPLGSLLACCSNLMNKIHTVSLKHIYRECNMIADSLAKNSINHEHGVIEFVCPPPHALQAFIDDSEDMTRPRRTSGSSSRTTV